MSKYTIKVRMPDGTTAEIEKPRSNKKKGGGSTKWQEVLLYKYKNMPNDQLLVRALELGGGDEMWDGNFSERGGWEYNLAKYELASRLEEWMNEKT